MSGIFGIVSKKTVQAAYFTGRTTIPTWEQSTAAWLFWENGFTVAIHDISKSQFKSKFLRRV